MTVDNVLYDPGDAAGAVEETPAWWRGVLADATHYHRTARRHGRPVDPAWRDWAEEAAIHLDLDVDAVLAEFDEVRHLPGKHDQKSHGRKGRGGELGARGTDAKDTEALYRTAGGGWDPARVANVHDPIVAGALSSGVRVDEPVMVFTGGGSGAGKGTLLRSGLVNLDGVVKSDSDEVKTELPEYQRMKRAGDTYAASFAHEESSYLAKRVVDESLRSGYSTMLDGTGDSSLQKMEGKIAGARESGAKKIVGEYVTIPLEMAMTRAQERAERTGREVPRETIEGTHRSVSQVFPQLAAKTGSGAAESFDELRLWDNSDDAGPRLIYEKSGGSERIIDEAAYSAFLSKGAA